ncbi:hypothetical protein D9758_001886 [Tetrapyrgos nigripes]|uniref:Homeobox domain-containing protein n=1 Tax=Tetrapyrgos nigripes TaxID=182062 RepID=A0A8H5GTD4_9AGAR|nr:hypothetical protein D9758_001886 [Tetrapyrgos nigripes]
MSSQRDDHYHYTPPASRPGKSSPLGDPQCSGFFQTGQGGRTVLPPLSSAFPTSCFPGPVSYSNQYTQPRATSQARFDAQFNPSVFNQWTQAPTNNQASMSSFGYYDTADNRYGSYYPTYPSRTSSPMPSDTGADADRKLPPLSTASPVAREERWNTTTYPVVSSPGMHNASGAMRSSPASYSFTAYPTTNTAASYTGYEMSMADVRNHVQAQSIHQTQASVLAADARSEPSYGRPTNQSQLASPYSSPPISPTTSEQEPTIKKKRKRADATQLKILNETYARTAFPSTEERQALAKELDMSARSVQIWFQNKRQSMRQTKQSTLTSGSTVNQAFTLSSPTSDASTEEAGTSAYETTPAPMTNASYVPRSSQVEGMNSPSLSYRRPRNREAHDPQRHSSQWQSQSGRY